MPKKLIDKLDKGRTSSSLEPEPFIERLVEDPAQEVRYRVVRGYLGRASQEGKWRLYVSLDLLDYVELDKADVVHAEQLSTDKEPLAGTIMWLKPEAELDRVLSDPVEAETELLEGSLAERLLPFAELDVPGDPFAPVAFTASLFSRCRPKTPHHTICGRRCLTKFDRAF